MQSAVRIKWLYYYSAWGKHPIKSVQIGRFRFCENITNYKSTPSFSQKIFITLRSRVQISFSLQGLSQMWRAFLFVQCAQDSYAPLAHMGSSPILAARPVTNVADFFICTMGTGFICTPKVHTWVQCSRGALSPILATLLFLRIIIIFINKIKISKVRSYGLAFLFGWTK